MKNLKNFFIPLIQIEAALEADLNVILQQQRERILIGTLRTAAVLGTLAWLILLPGLLRDGLLDLVFFYTLLLTVLWFIALKLSLAYHLRAGSFILLFCSLGVIDLIEFGFSSEAIIFFVVFSILATILLGSRMGVAALLLSLVILAGVGWQISAGLIAAPSLPALPVWEEIIYICVIFLLGVGLLITGLTVLLNGFDLAWRQEQLAMGQMQQERDLLEERVLERTRELVAARDRAIEASSFKSQLLARVSHELRTPLASILGYTELLQIGSFGPISAKQQATLGQVVYSTHELTDLVNKLLAQAQFENDQLALTITSFRLIEMVKPIVARLNSLAETKGLNLALEIDPHLPCCLNGDAKRLQEILVNLISNAIKFTKSGTVQVHLYQSHPNRWAIEVTDTGIGIPLEMQAYIFEPFRQGDGSITREYGGAGLGLAIVKQLVTLMQGEITLKSEVGRGSTFTVMLPLNSAQENNG
jgi:signal transduction histidine kinase